MLSWLLAQAADSGGIDVGAALVSYGVAAPFVAWLIWQNRSTSNQLEAERKANRELYDRIIAQQERMAPILEQAARALDHAVERR